MNVEDIKRRIEKFASERDSSKLFKRFIELDIVFQLVKVPPNHLLLIKN